MKKTLLVAFAGAFAFSAVAQNDTLLHEDFNVDPTGTTIIVGAPSGNDATWINLDEDGLSDANGRDQHWYWSTTGFVEPDTTGAYLSSSWLTNFLPGNRNWLFTPAIPIVDANATLSWRSAPREGPQYLDGYTVLVSTTDNIETSFTDTIFLAAQYLSGTDSASYTFSPGFIHGFDPSTMMIDTNLLPPNGTGGNVGRLTTHSVSLAAYSGQTIYIAFLHNSDDDNLIAVDDIMVMGTASGVGVEELDFAFTTYPNPATELVTIEFTMPTTAPLNIELLDVTGKVIDYISAGVRIQGDHTITHDVSNLPAGIYTLNLVTPKGVSSKQLVVN